MLVGTLNTLFFLYLFLFRRMTVAQLAEQGEYRFFYATNRRAGADADSLEERFGSEREASLKFGSFDAEIQPTLGLGMLINPTEWFQNEEIRIKNVDALEQSAFVDKLRDLAASPAAFAAKAAA